ncbi:MAG: DUF2203 domain-containing protein [Myxococcaceae bacterium]|nr:DUF2203 domain-containing protein [Myxococcaceae bacterium]
MRHFGIEEANGLIPLLRRTFQTVRPLAEKLDDTQGPEHDALAEKIQGELQPLVDSGIEVKALDGLVDFRALLEGRTVYLCWRWGEERITHWHELDTGFAGRRPIKAGDTFGKSYLS